MDIPNLDPNTFWLVIAYIVIRDALIPLITKILPQNAERHADLEARETAALEEIGRAITQSSERLNVIESGQGSIIKSLEEQSKALAVLVDRVARSSNNRTRKGD